MSIRLKLSVLTMFAGLAAFSGCGDDSDSDDPAKGGEAGESSSTGGKTGGTGGKASTGGTSDGGSTDPGVGGESDGGSTSPGGAPSDGGTPSDGGETSSTGGMGAGGAPAGTCEYPQCLADLQANCVPEGECTQAIDITDIMNPTIAMCWENGVKAGMADYDVATGSGTFEFQKDGDTCYLIEFTGDGAGDSSLVYKDASGDTVATVENDADTESQTITCADSGQVVVYTPSSCPDPEPGSQPPDQSECAMGACTLD